MNLLACGCQVISFLLRTLSFRTTASERPRCPSELRSVRRRSATALAVPADGVVDQRRQRLPARHSGSTASSSRACAAYCARQWPWPWPCRRCPQQRQRLGHRVVVVDRALQQLAQPVAVGPGFSQRVQHRQGVHTFTQVGAGQLARLVGVAVDVDDVVGDLERGADDAAEAAQPLDLVIVGARERRAESARGRDQARRLLVDHLQVVRRCGSTRPRRRRGSRASGR